ncbi:alpha/beta hydrolase [Anaerosphaera multitolerans]|uniref:Alpha/beta hydrolase n=2 Tax=Anaerosphaera multitolerans TaxID=2487351 RepID=A0A437S9S6_9FIRM|nr:alpha/beta hydrolase [Anaerosphaera multitolerans]
MDYISFGKGSEVLIILPGLGDGFITVKGMALPLALTYRNYAKRFKVYIFSRKSPLKDGYTTRDMAEDQAEAMKILNITKANIMGISQGGMIAQYLAIDYPQLLKILILAVTLSKQNETVKQVVSNWMEMAEAENYMDIVIDTSEKSYSENYLRKIRPFYPLLGRFKKPKDFNRFLVQANSCLNHNSHNELHRISCPTLIIGGGQDKILGSNSSFEIAKKVNNNELFIYDNLGHGAYEEARDFNKRVINFLLKSKI